MLDQETLRARALERVLYEAAWKNERVANKFRGSIWLAVGIAMFLARPSATPVIHFTWGLIVLSFDMVYMKHTFRRWMPWVLTMVDVAVLAIGMHAGYPEALARGLEFGEHHLSGATVGLMLVLSVNMMRFSWKLSLVSTLWAIVAFTALRVANDRFDALSLVDWVLLGSLAAMLAYSSIRFRTILQRVMIDVRAMQDARVASLSKLVAGVAHEMNTPLGALKANTQLTGRATEILQAQLTEPDKKTGRALKSLEKVQGSSATAVERVVGIVDSLRRFARLDEAEVQRVQVRECLEACIGLLPAEARDGLNIETSYGETPEVSCKPTQLNQVFMSLLENAIEAVDQGGTIRIETLVEGENVLVSITDDGRGIEAARLPTIFEPSFNRAGDRAKMSFGLTSSKSIVSDHGGEITLSSALGKGTTVRVLLPV